MADDDMAGNLDEFESLLRLHMHDVLASVSADWRSELVPKDVKKRAERVFQRYSLHGGPPGSKSERLEFSDYAQIIDVNWNDAFAKVFDDRDLIIFRFKELTPIRNKIEHSRAVTENERKKFEYHTEEIIKALLANGPDHEAAAGYLERYDKRATDAYQGAVRAILQDKYPDQTAHFAHSLREVIDLLAKAGQTKSEGDRRKKGGRAAAIQRAVDPYCGSPLCDDYSLLEDMYKQLSAIAHHEESITTTGALAMLGQACSALLRIARPQLEVEDEAEDVIRKEPSDSGARRLAELSGKEVTRIRMAQLLTPDWLPHLIGVGLFAEPPPGAGTGSGSGVRIARPLSAYLARCARQYPDLVSGLVLAFPADGVQSRQSLYADFLRCAANFDPETMEETAQKALDDGWARILVSHRFVEPFAAFVEALFRNKKYRVAEALAYDALKPPPQSGEEGSKPADPPHVETLGVDLFASALGEVARRAVRACPKEGIELLARLLEVHARGHGSVAWELPGRVASIEDSNQNGAGPVNALVSELRDALERVGGDDPGLLRSIMPALYKRDGMLYRRLELHIYRRFLQSFAGEVALSLHTYFGINEAYHEYYLLLRESFAGLPGPAKESLYALADRACAEGDERGFRGDPASQRLALKKFLFLDAISAHLDKRHAKECERLRSAFGEPPHPGYLNYMETYTGGGVGLPAPPECGDADSVLQGVLVSMPPTGPLAEYEDRAADRLEACVARDPADYIQGSAALGDARPAIQCAFLAGLEKAIQKKRLGSLPDLENLFMHIIGLELDGQSTRSGNGLWDTPLRICWLLDESFRQDAVGPELAESLEMIILALVEAGDRRGSSDCALDEDSLMGPIAGVGGLSFTLLFRYWLWRGGAKGAAGERFDPALHEIIDGYIDGGAGRHTTCRHLAIGMFAAAIHQRDPGWLRTIVERVERTREKVPFWAAYVAHNTLHRDAFSTLWKSYDRFLNGKVLYKQGLVAVVDATFHHVALAYFYGLDHADGIFKRFVREAEPATIGRTVAPLALIMKGKEGDEAFDLEKVAGLWKEEKFAQLDLGIWFRHTPLDKKTAIGLYRDYLGRYEGTFDILAAPVDDLEKYAKEFPCETALCLLHIVKKSLLVDAQAVGRIVGRLEEYGGREIDDACGAIREALAARGLYSEGD